MANDNQSIGIIISVAIAVLLGVILVGIIADSVQDKAQLTGVTETVDISTYRQVGGEVNETYTISLPDILTYTPSDDTEAWKNTKSACTISAITFKNASGTAGVSGTDYTLVADGAGVTGTLLLVNSTNGGTIFYAGSSNTTTIGYNYCPDEYIDGWASTVFKLVPGFFALAILGVAIFVIFYILKKEGIELGM